MEQYINTNYKKQLLRLYKECDLYQYIKPQYNLVLRYNLKYERYTLEEAIELQEFWRVQTKNCLRYSDSTIYNDIMNIYFLWLYNQYALTLKKIIIKYVSSLKIKNTKKKSINAKLIKLIDSTNRMDDLYEKLKRFINSRFGLATLMPFQLTSELFSVIKEMKVE